MLATKIVFSNLLEVVKMFQTKCFCSVFWAKSKPKTTHRTLRVPRLRAKLATDTAGTQNAEPECPGGFFCVFVSSLRKHLCPKQSNYFRKINIEVLRSIHEFIIYCQLLLIEKKKHISTLVFVSQIGWGYPKLRSGISEPIGCLSQVELSKLTRRLSNYHLLSSWH